MVRHTSPPATNENYEQWPWPVTDQRWIACRRCRVHNVAQQRLDPVNEMARCVECGFLAERRVKDGAILQPTEHQREELAGRAGYVDPTLRCYVEFDGFDAARVSATIDCPRYVRRVPSRTLQEYLEMQQLFEAQRVAREESARQNRQMWLLAIFTTGFALVGSVLAALIGRGSILGPVG